VFAYCYWLVGALFTVAAKKIGDTDDDDLQ
jgi:hypothetical protein